MSHKGLIRTFEEFKNLTSEEKDFFLFETLHDVRDGLGTLLDNLTLDKLEQHFDKRYAPKIVAKIVYGAVGTILMGFIVAVLVLIGWKQ